MSGLRRCLFVLAATVLAAPTALADSNDFDIVKVGEGACAGDYSLCLCEELDVWVGVNLPNLIVPWPPGSIPPVWVEWEDPVLAAGPCA